MEATTPIYGPSPLREAYRAFMLFEDIKNTRHRIMLSLLPEYPEGQADNPVFINVPRMEPRFNAQ